MPTIRCPFCKRTYEVAPGVIGQKGQCSSCKQIFIAQVDDAFPFNPTGQSAPYAQQPQNPQEQWSPNPPQGNMQQGYGQPMGQGAPYAQPPQNPQA